MARTTRIVCAAGLALVVFGTLVASARQPAAGSAVPEVLVTARGPNAVVDEVVVRPTSVQDMAETTSTRTSVN
ncbi:hypothetical protein FJY69_07400 [candidate division WOR-3 bacterium]|nr:hypothetical protein [candidate division WOR-3 bacterium]